MKATSLPSTLAHLMTLLVLSAAQGFDFIYFVQQWPGSLCDTMKSCCYPTTGKPLSDFGIYGLWPNNEDGTYPSNCNPDNPFDITKISDLMGRMVSDWPTLACPSSNGRRFWKHEWEKHGTCSESVLDQRQYFETALFLKREVDLLGVLQAADSAGVVPDGGSYSYTSISRAIEKGVGYLAGIECNRDEAGNSQLYQVYLCLDSSAASFIDCPRLPLSRCNLTRIQFPVF